MENQKYKVPKELIIIGIIFYLALFSIFVYDEWEEDTVKQGEAIGLNFPLLIGGFIALFCASKNYKWAREIGKKGNFAFFVGLFLGLMGLLIYYIYYRVNNIEKEDKIKRMFGLSLLAISIIFGVIIFILLGFLIYGDDSSYDSNYTSVPIEIENSCNDFCAQYEEVTHYYFDYIINGEYYVCYCIDNEERLINKKSFEE